jgi:tetratricopeptide (TPR) repeat protein
MADNDARIEQFRKMAEADPTNELGHFSLGRALYDAGQFAEAVASFQRALELNPNLSKVYQLLATCLLKLNRNDDAVGTLTRGVQVADQRGDHLPKNEMIRMLQDLGAPIPEIRKSEKTVELSEDQIVDARTGQIGTKMKHPPFNNPMGRFIQQHISAESWREWIGMGTKVINELRLPLSDPQAQKIFDQHMLEFLNLTEAWEAEKNKG